MGIHDHLPSRRDFCRSAGLSIAALASAPFLTVDRTGGAPVFNVKTFGAIGDGKSMDAKAIQSAIDAAHRAGGGTVLLPAGNYLSGTLFLKSKVELHLEANATLLGSTARPDYQKQFWYALLLAEGQENISISGAGTINGQGRELAQDVIQRVKRGEIKDPLGNNRPNERERPQIIEFRSCRDVRVTGVTIRDSSCWVQNYIECHDVLIDRIRVNSTAFWNNDGIDITDCQRVRISNCDINSADDGICLKSANSESRCDDVEISNCRIRSSASAFKCGTASHGGFRNIRVHGLVIHDTYRSAVALECVDGGAFENVRIENIRATNTGNAIFLRLGHRNQRVPIGRMNDIVIRDVRVEVPARVPDAGYETAGPPVVEPHNLIPSSITGLPDHPVRNVILEDIEIVYAGGGRTERAHVPITNLSQVPEQAKDYPEFSMFGELPAWGFYARHAEGIELRNFHISLKQPDFRPAMVFDDLHQLQLDRVGMGQFSGSPVIVLKDSPEAFLKEVRTPRDNRERVRLIGNSSLK